MHTRIIGFGGLSQSDQFPNTVVKFSNLIRVISGKTI